MIKMFLIRHYKTWLFFSFLMIALSSAAQDSIFIRAEVDKNKILIGERINLILLAKFPSNEPMRFFDIDSIEHFEIMQRQKIDTTDEDGSIELKQIMVLTSFDSGHWVIPSFILSGHEPRLTDSIPVDVGFSPFDPNQEYHDIKDVIDVQAEEEKAKKQEWYWYVIAAVVALIVTIFFLIRKKKPAVAEKAPPLDAYREAMSELEKLRKENSEPKLFFTSLTDTFRLYVSRRTGISSLQKTTDDLVVQLKSLKMGTEDFNNLAQALRMSDFVKFAKYEAGSNDKQDSFNIIKRSIDLIEADNAVRLV